MAGHLQVIPIVPTSGLDLSRTPSQSNVGTFYQLRGWKQSETEPGRLVQPFAWLNNTALTQGTYYNGGSLTEPTTAAITLQLFNVVPTLGTAVIIKDYCAQGGGSQTKVYHQTTIPAGTGATKHCMVVINDVTNLGVTLGNTLDIVIDGATTFKYRINGGAYTTLVPITTSGVSILAGFATVYFLTAAGFTVADTWSWTRNDWVTGTTTNVTLAVPLCSTHWRTKTFFLNAAGRVMQVAVDTASSVPYIISTGYQPIYGRSINTFQDHLIVTGYTTSATTSVADTSLVVGWSDLNDLDCFFGTDVNEADTYTIPAEYRGTVPITQLVTSFVFNAQLYILTDSAVYVTSYLGLPLVFSFQKYGTLDLGWAATGSGIPPCGSPVIAEGSEYGVYILGVYRLYFFNGAGFSDLTSTITGAGSTPFYSIHYLPYRHEIWIRSPTNYTLCFSEITKTWHQRFANFDFVVSQFSSIACPTETDVRLGIGNRKYLSPDNGVNTIAYDSLGGTAFGTPTIITQMITDGQFSKQKETDSVFLRAYYPAFGGNAPTAAQVTLTLKWIPSITGEVGTVATNALAVWQGNTASRFLSFPRLSFAGLQFQLEYTSSDVTKCPKDLSFYGLEAVINGWNIDETDR